MLSIFRWKKNTVFNSLFACYHLLKLKKVMKIMFLSVISKVRPAIMPGGIPSVSTHAKYIVHQCVQESKGYCSFIFLSCASSSRKLYIPIEWHTFFQQFICDSSVYIKLVEHKSKYNS